MSDIGDTRIALQSALIQIATLTAENEKLRGKVGELEHRLEIDRHYVLRDDKLVQETVPPAERADVPDGITCRDESIKILDGNIERLRARAEAAEAQLATARMALERLASMEALTSPFSMSTGPASRELNARIDYAVAALKEPGT